MSKCITAIKHQKNLNPITYYTLIFASGIFMGATVAPIGAWFLAWVALAPLW
ncbi:MAG: apolipoprotein N-acyltransferase, partial [Cyanobacteriota bacterium]